MGGPIRISNDDSEYEFAMNRMYECFLSFVDGSYDNNEKERIEAIVLIKRVRRKYNITEIDVYEASEEIGCICSNVDDINYDEEYIIQTTPTLDHCTYTNFEDLMYSLRISERVNLIERLTKP